MEKKLKLNKAKKWVKLGIVASLISHFIIEIYHYDYAIQQVLKLNLTVRPMLFLFGTFILFLFYTLFSSIVGNSIIGSILLILFSWIIGMGTNLKSLHRAEPIYPNEVYWIKELPFLFQMIGIGKTILIITVIIITLVALITFHKYKIKTEKEQKIKKEKILIRFLGIVLSLILFLNISKFNYSGNKFKKIYNKYTSWVGFSQPVNYDKNGFIAGFLYNLDAPPMEMPSNYSKATIESIFNKYKDTSIELNKNKNNLMTNTNVIFIMNESFSDPYNLEGIESNIDPLPNYRTIIDDTLSGSLLVPGYGGGTATNEFQVLTGVSMEPLSPHVTSPFVQMTQRMNELPSIVNKMNDYGYNTTAIHAYSPTYYRRTDVYSYLGFDEFIHADTMRYTNKPTDTHEYISDESIYRELLDVMNETDGVDFLHLVTMQNHSGYRNKYEINKFEVSGSGDYGSANGYFQDLQNSDTALLQLIKKLEEYPEPILLLFWGDHLPGFYEGEVTKINSAIKLHETPFFIYSNELELQGDMGMRSLIYLNNYIIEILNLEMTPFEALMTNLEENLPILDKRMYYSTSNSQEVFSRAELSSKNLEILEDYTLLMFDVTSGNNYAKEIGFFDYFK